MNRTSLTFLFLLVAAAGALLTGCDGGPAKAPVAAAAARFVGAATCADCHAETVAAWRGSHHALAMQPATEGAVLGAFDNTEFVHNGVTTRFYRRDGKFVVETDSASGQREAFPVRYTFGVDPLQQYLLELPDGRIHASGVAWDSRPANSGGQRWMHVYGNEPIDHEDILHWTKPTQNWDSMCAFCHSTGVIKSFDVTSGSFDTTWEEINVACEGCHGPASTHVEQAGAGFAARSPDNGFGFDFDERANVQWMPDAERGNSRRSEPRTTQVEIDTCGACHSRRSQIERQPLPGRDLLDGFLPALLQSPLYHVDGQIRDEVYVYGSFLQSRMYQQGVTCSDCHEPHSLALRAPGSDVCLQCHAADKFAQAEHHLHPDNSSGADCIACHMPATTYMQVDARHDHSFRKPRPDLSESYGTPDACTNCHADRNPQWAADILRARNKLPLTAHWSDKLAVVLGARAGAREQIEVLASDADVPAIVRASAIVRAPDYGDALLFERLSALAGSEESLVRWAVARLLQSAPETIVTENAPAMLDDPVKAVRIAAANSLAPLSLELLPAGYQRRLQAGLEEYVAAEMVNNERAEAHTNIGNLERMLGRPQKSERAYRTAIGLNPYFVPASVNLADLYRDLERDADGEAFLRAAVERLPGQPSLHYALGLNLYRQGRAGEARAELLAAAEAPDAEPAMALAYGLILDAQGETGQAEAYLSNALERFGDDPGLLSALINLYQRMNRHEAANLLIARLRKP